STCRTRTRVGSSLVTSGSATDTTSHPLLTETLEDGLLDQQVSSKAIEPADYQHVSVAALKPGERVNQSDTSLEAVRARESFVCENVHQAQAGALGVLSDGDALSREPIPVLRLLGSRDPHIPDRATAPRTYSSRFGYTAGQSVIAHRGRHW